MNKKNNTINPNTSKAPIPSLTQFIFLTIKNPSNNSTTNGKVSNKYPYNKNQPNINFIPFDKRLYLFLSNVCLNK